MGVTNKFLKNFSWGGKEGFDIFDIEKSFEVSERMCERRNVKFTKEDREIMKHILSEELKYHSH